MSTSTNCKATDSCLRNSCGTTPHSAIRPSSPHARVHLVLRQHKVYAAISNLQAPDLLCHQQHISPCTPRPPDAWLQHFLADLPSRLHLFSDQGIANTLWALGKLRSRPSQQCLDALLGHMQLALGRYSAQHLAMSAWGLAKLGARPTEAWLEVSTGPDLQRMGAADRCA